MIIEMLQYGFMQKAFLTGILVAISCSLLGVFLILRRYALIGDGIAHISFGGIATGIIFNIFPFLSALLFSIIGAIGILHLSEKSKIYGDSAIGIISHASLGIGIFIISITKGVNVDILSYLFGSILAIKTSEIMVSIILTIIVIVSIIIFYHELFYMTFDEESAKVSGIKTKFLNTLLILLTAITVVSSMKVVGLLLASSLIILPASSALQLQKSFSKTLLYSVLISVISVVIGITISYQFDFAVSGTIVLMNTAIFVAILIIKKILTLKS